MAKGKITKVEIPGPEPKRIYVEVTGSDGNKRAKPFHRMTVKGADAGKVFEFIHWAMCYSIARHGTLDASKWESERNVGKAEEPKRE